MAPITTQDLRNFNKEELENKLKDFKQELVKLRAQASGQNAARGTRIGDVRKSIARTLTVINLTQRQHLNELYKGKQHVPKDLRPKLTRAIRRRLTVKQQQLKTVKAQKKAAAFPQRKYAIKA